MKGLLGEPLLQCRAFLDLGRQRRIGALKATPDAASQEDCKHHRQEQRECGEPCDQSLTVLAFSKGVGQRSILRVLLFVGQALHLPLELHSRNGQPRARVSRRLMAGGAQAFREDTHGSIYARQPSLDQGFVLTGRPQDAELAFEKVQAQLDPRQIAAPL